MPKGTYQRSAVKLRVEVMLAPWVHEALTMKAAERRETIGRYIAKMCDRRAEAEQ